VEKVFNQVVNFFDLIQQKVEKEKAKIFLISSYDLYTTFD